jgi:hypothetical protein
METFVYVCGVCLYVRVCVWICVCKHNIVSFKINILLNTYSLTHNLYALIVMGTWYL